MTDVETTARATSALLDSGGDARRGIVVRDAVPQAATLGYIVAGALIGPHLLALIDDPEDLSSVTELGIALLLFVVGLELNPSRLWRTPR